MFEAPEKINAYGHFLHNLGSPPGGTHQASCHRPAYYRNIQLAFRTKAARPVDIRAAELLTPPTPPGRCTGSADRSGLCDLSPAASDSGHDLPGAAFIEGDVYHNVVAGFQVWWVSAWYIFSICLLGLHLRHGIWSMFQSVGFNHPRYTPFLRARPSGSP